MNLSKTLVFVFIFYHKLGHSILFFLVPNLFRFTQIKIALMVPNRQALRDAHCEVQLSCKASEK